MIKKAFFLSITVFMFSCFKIKHQNNLIAFNEPNYIEKPNVIVILVDDAGYVDFGFMGSKDLKTPHIDALAENGVVFSDFHVSSTVCAPSRAGLMTGKYQQRFGFEANGTGDKSTGDVGLSEDVTTMADVFKQHDYSTVAIGKWHLGASTSDQPNQRGFDDFYGFLGGGRSYFPLEQPSKEHLLQHNGKRISFDGYLTDVLGDYSVKYIKEHKDKPFFMYLAYNAVHTPMEAKKEDLEKFKDHPRQTLAAMTWSLDENIGKLYTALKELKLLDNTLIYFLSDNGGAHNNMSDNGKLKGWKGNEFEGGHRVPFIVSWPQKFKGGQIFNGLTSSLDIFSTSIAASGIRKDDELQLDGVNLIPYLTAEKSGNPHNDLYWRKLDESAARIGDTKLVRLKDFGSTVYDLSNDLGEMNDLSEIDTASTNLLIKKLENWESKLTDPLWREGKAWENITYYIHKQLMENKDVLYKQPPLRKVPLE